MIKDLILKTNAIKFGDFTFTSGKKSKYYVDIKEAETYMSFLKEASEEIAAKLDGRNTIAGVELGAVPLVVATAIKMDVPYLMIRKEEREHGNKDPVIGIVQKGRQVDIIEDVVTTGNSVLRAVNLLRAKGAIVNRVICVVDWEAGGAALLEKHGVRLIPLVRISEILH